MALTSIEHADKLELPTSWNITATAFHRMEFAKELLRMQDSKTAESVEELYEIGEHAKVAEILSKTASQAPPPATDEEAHEAWLERMFMLTESLWQTRQYADCITKCALTLSQVCAIVKQDESLNLLKTADCCLQMLEEEGDSSEALTAEVSKSLCQSLVGIIVAQINGTLASRTTLPWLLFYQVVRSEELKNPPSCINMQLYPPSVELLISAHEYLGQKSLCTEDCGRLLHLLVETLAPLSRLDGSDGALKRALDQALYCLYCHPSKKSRARHLVDHGSSALALKWDKCAVLMSVVRPKKLPEFDDFKALSITADTEALLRRFVALIPDCYQLQERCKKLESYLNDRKDRSGFPETLEDFPEGLRDLFYLLGDYNFKNSNFEAAADLCVKDLALNPTRLDSWVALSLSRASLVEEKVCRNRPQDLDDILDESYKALNTFREAIKVAGDSATVHIESANFAYVMSAHCSRLFKSDTTSLSMENFEKVERRGKLFVAFAKSCYDKALELLKDVKDPDSVDETWLVKFMRGKLLEKVNRSNIDPALREYLESMRNLVGQGAGVPRKIGFGPGTPDLSLELLEVYYRFHCSVLKLETRTEVKIDEATLENLWKRVAELDEIKIFAFEDLKKRSDCKRDWDNLARICLEALEVTKNIFPHHYKALHQLTRHALRRGEFGRAKKYLMGGGTGKEPSLFGERKANNLFNGIWRFPVSEFERAGSFPAHAGKCLTVLFEVFRETGDHAGFLEAACLLRKAPDGERKYLFEEERKTFHVEACSSLMINLQKITSDLLSKDGESKKKVRCLMDLSHALTRLKKFYPKCDQVKDMMKKMYCNLTKRKECTFDEITTLVVKLNQAEKTEGIKNMSEEKLALLLSECVPKHKVTPQLPSMQSMQSASAAAAAASAAAASAAASGSNSNSDLINNMWLAAAAAAASSQIAMFNAASSIAQQAMASFSQQQVKALLTQQQQQQQRPTTSTKLQQRHPGNKANKDKQQSSVVRPSTTAAATATTSSTTPNTTPKQRPQQQQQNPSKPRPQQHQQQQNINKPRPQQHQQQQNINKPRPQQQAINKPRPQQQQQNPSKPRPQQQSQNLNKPRPQLQQLQSSKPKPHNNNNCSSNNNKATSPDRNSC